MHIESHTDNIKIMRSNVVVTRECAIQKSILIILLENDILLANAITV